MFLQLAGVDVDRATLKKRRVTAATPSGFSWSIRRNGIDAITTRADYSTLLGHRTSSRSAGAAVNLGERSPVVCLRRLCSARRLLDHHQTVRLAPFSPQQERINWR